MSGSPSGPANRASSAHSAALAAAVVLVLVTILPWQRTLSAGTVSGFESGGWVTLILGAVATWRLWVLRSSGSRRDATVAIVTGVLATIVTVYLLIYFLTTKEGLLEEVRTTTPQVGVYVAIAASLVLTASAFLLRREVR